MSAYYDSYARDRGWTGSSDPSEIDILFFDRALGDYVGSNSVVLDFGFGDGRLLGWLRRRGAQVNGVELQGSLVEGARSAGYRAEHSLSAFPDAHFDLITVFDVLEHINRDALSNLVLELRAKLRPGGLVAVRVPNSQVPAGLAVQFSDITHLTLLSLPTVVALFRQADLEIAAASGSPDVLQRPSSFHQLMLRAQQALAMVLRRLLHRMLGIPSYVPTTPNVLVVGRRPIG
jgi:2-polyprenyl-3-methyl-5-hydroxy-6-metoxy-1,4-benzoquinol methylase